jgi:hypothetical protein
VARGYRKNSAAPIVKPGEHVELVRWKITDDGWHPVSVSGRFLRMEADSWQLVKGDHVVSYPRDLWELCIA